MNKNFVKIVLLLCVIGMGLSLTLLLQHYRHLSSGVLEKSFCSINEYIDCDVVNASQYSKIGSIPVSGLGFIFYLVITVYSLCALRTTSQKCQELPFCFLMALAGLAISLYFAYLSFFKLHALCLLCTGMYIVNLLLVLVLPFAMGVGYRGLATALRFEPKLIKYSVLTALIFLIGIGGLEAANRIALQQKSKPGGKPPTDAHGHAHPHPDDPDQKEIPLDKLLETHFLQPALPLDTTGRPSLGNPQASVRIVEFSDFQCPFCRQAALYFKTTIEEFKDDVAFNFVNYPLDMACNPQIKRPLHPQACNAAKAALCANQQGKFWPLHDLIFENQHRLKEDSFAELAQMAGLDVNAFKACAQSPEAAALLARDMALAGQAQISGTPSVFINGRKVTHWSKPEFLKAVLEVELSR